MEPEGRIAELVHGAARGEKAAWDALVDRFAGMVWSIARSHRLSAGNAADVSQTTWLRLVEHLDRIQQPERVGAWLATTAKRESLRVIRMTSRQVADGHDFDMLPDTHSGATVDSDLLATERDEGLAELIDRLPCRC